MHIHHGHSSNHSHHAHHAPSGAGQGSRALLAGLFLTFVFALVELSGGWFFGSLALVAWMAWNKKHCERFMFAVACGLIAGEGLGGILNAIWKFTSALLSS